MSRVLKTRRRFRLVPSPAMLVAVTALLFGTAGTAFGNHGFDHVRNAVNAIDVQDGSLTGRDIKNKSLTKADFRGSVQGPRGLPGQNGTNGTNGAQGPAGFSRLDYNSVTITQSANAQDGGTVACDAGLRVVGGGVFTSGSYAEQQVNSSYPSNGASPPTFGNTHWTAYVDRYNVPSGSRTFTVYVICAPAAQVT